jgi:hypothetical protein
VDEAAEAVAATDLADGRRWRWLRTLRREELERAVRPLRVVVLDEDAQDAFEVAAVDDQQPVETFDADGSDEPLGDGVCLRRPHRRLDDSDAAAAKTSLKGAVYLLSRSRIRNRVAVVGEVEAEVACLLGDPGTVGVGRAAGKPDGWLACAMTNSA